MSIYRRGEVWYYYITHEGRRFRGSTGKSEKAAAQRFHDELRAELWKQRRGGLTFHGALEAWAPASGPDRYRVDKLTETIPDKPLEDVTGEWLEQVLPNTSAGSFNRYANVVAAAWNKARKRQELPPLHIERKETPKGRVRWLTAEEWKALRNALPDHQRPMAELAISTGLRQSNVFRLEWSRVDFARQRIWIPGAQTKNGEPIGIKLNDDALRVLKAQHRRTKGLRWVFVGRDGKKPPTEIKTAWKTACEAAGLKDFRWHDLRHTWATWHIMGGTPKEVLQRLGAWQDERMVQRYAHLSDSFVDEYAGNSKPYQPRHISRHKGKKAA